MTEQSEMDEVLARVRELVGEILAPGEVIRSEREQELAFLVESLDTWASNGGPLPGDWIKKQGQST